MLSDSFRGNSTDKNVFTNVFNGPGKGTRNLSQGKYLHAMKYQHQNHEPLKCLEWSIKKKMDPA